ncbi:hypothetical protein PCANC_07664 [Puccinia coronata f. sp. avenae]|uniref:K Homology domain-containing protein n=1 Tax=Puccinia coronata f. sp. avenae TaxID=200324 RepID=A0A2N5T2Q3_9BASI|nr:hypothetical protein PCASD_23260 [Puccinia coronata f. sp. avenae]PLW19766.1 hypothetical protein PCANC_07664 [Puccinia coronata f. sp. avenae]
MTTTATAATAAASNHNDMNNNNRSNNNNNNNSTSSPQHQIRKRSRSTSGASIGGTLQKRQNLDHPEQEYSSKQRDSAKPTHSDLNVGGMNSTTATANAVTPTSTGPNPGPNGLDNHNGTMPSNSGPQPIESHHQIPSHLPSSLSHDHNAAHPDAQSHQSMALQHQAGSSQQQNPAHAIAATQTIQMRALIVTQDASVIIGKGGRHINEVREKSGARATISEAVPGNAERILSVAGPLDAVSKAFGLIVRRINDEPFDVPSVPGSRAVTIRFIVPNSRMGSVIGKAGSKIKEIQDMSGARVQASEALLPGSTERVLSISGVADAVHIAVYYVGMILVDNQERMPANTSYRPGGGNGGGGGGGHLGHSGHGGQLGHHHMGGRAPPPGAIGPGGAGGGGNGGGAYGPYPGGPAAMPHGHHAHHGHHHAGPPLAGGPAGAGGGYPNPAHQPGSQTQQIYIPNGFVGAVIGKGGQKINEIRQASATHIKIMEPGEGGQDSSANERLVTITGQPLNIQMAVSLLYRRLEAEKLKFENPGLASGL